MASSNRVAGGLKATLHNPKVSDEAKASAQERLDNMDSSFETEAPSSRSNDIGEDTENLSQQQLGGYKAARKNPNVSDAAKEHAQEILEEHGQA